MRVLDSSAFGSGLRDNFEHTVWTNYFIKHASMTEGYTGELDKATLVKRNGDDYEREDVSAMWYGFRMGFTYATEPIKPKAV